MVMCPVCSTGSPKLVRQLDGYTQYDCVHCHLRFSDPMQNPGAEWYEKSEIYRAVEKPTPLYMARRDIRSKLFFPLKLAPGGKLVDLGCGTGTLLKLAELEGYRVTGVDYNPISLKKAETFYGLQDLRQDTLEDFLAASDEQFDIAWLFSVLEHVGNPAQLVAQIYQRIVPGGYFVCTVPSHERTPQIFDPILDTPPHHLTLWSKDALNTCLVDSGFEVKQIIPSPLLPEHLLLYTTHRFPSLQNQNMLTSSIGAFCYWVLFPPLAQIIRWVRPGSGQFLLFAVAQRAT